MNRESPERGVNPVRDPGANVPGGASNPGFEVNRETPVSPKVAPKTREGVGIEPLKADVRMAP